MAMGPHRTKPIPRVLAPGDGPEAPTVPFVDCLTRVLGPEGFHGFVEGLCQPCYTQRMGRPSLPPDVQLRWLLPGFPLGLASERRMQ